MRSNRIIFAIFQNQIKNVLKNTSVLILFFIYPIIAFVMTTAMSEQLGQAAFFISVFGTMHVVFTPIVTTAAIIAEEKEKNTLRVLILSNVKPFEYLISIGGFVFICTLLTASSFLAMGNYSGVAAFQFILYMAIGCICSIIFGLSIGGAAKNTMGANAIAAPAGMLFAFLPMLASFNKSIEKISRFTYGQQVSNLISNPKNIGFSLENIVVIAVNLLLFIIAFIVVFRRNRLDN
ncbi:MAG: ABC transporter permease [Ruminiclostridium sp.]